ncbi:hypothetical protein Nepgr_005569 [Nepenthes gracilis]|uniref:Secreted protein n=1 Tax=Nepenthes gracilis TaxID=150966 RepID=A0AAD3S3F0_NEPGR|nr:hypothetical protein Nepgr_005569 [Nepenthes gracilis]
MCTNWSSDRWSRAELARIWFWVLLATNGMSSLDGSGNDSSSDTICKHWQSRQWFWALQGGNILGDVFDHGINRSYWHWTYGTM